MASLPLVDVAYYSSDESVGDASILTARSSSDRADSIAADDALAAAVDTHVQRAADEAAADAAAETVVRAHLCAAGITDDAAMMLMATSVADLRLVALEIFGDSVPDRQWEVLHRLWSNSAFLGRLAVLEKTRTLFDSNGYPLSCPAVAVPAVPAAPNIPPALFVKTVTATSPQLYSCSSAGSAALAATTHMVLASSTSGPKRSSIPAPPMIPGMAGHSVVAKRWDIVLKMCRAALSDLGGEAPRFVSLHRDGDPSPSHMALQDSVYRDKLQNPATVRGYLRDLDILVKWSALNNSSPPFPNLGPGRGGGRGPTSSYEGFKF